MSIEIRKVGDGFLKEMEKACNITLIYYNIL